MCARTVNGSEQLSYCCSGTFIFLECSSVLNDATPVTNAFLSYLVNVSFSDNILGKRVGPSIILDIPVSVLSYMNINFR